MRKSYFMYRMCMVILALFVLPTSVYSAAGTKDKGLICAAGTSGSLVVANNTWQYYELKFTRGGLNIKESFIGIWTDEPAIEYIQCPKDFDVVSLYCALTRTCLVAYQHTQIQETGSYTICQDSKGIYFFNNRTRRRLLPTEKNKGKFSD